MLQKIKNGINLFKNLSIIYSKNTKQLSNNKVYFDLIDSRIIPAYFFIIYPFVEEGYQVYLKLNLKFLAGFYKNDQELLRFPNLHVCLNIPNNTNEIIIFDDPKKKNFYSGFYVNPNDLIERKNDGIRLPIFMHPSVYLTKKHIRVDNLRSSEKKMRIFFSGNTKKEAYDNPAIRRKFFMPNRYEIISFLQRNLEKDKLEIITSKLQWEQIFSKPLLNKLILLKWEWSQESTLNFDIKVSSNDWLPTLATAQFFLACPGIVTPQSHNVIEAMSVGCIPILSYNDFFYPPLEHNVNCIYFKDEEDLLIKINTILEMNESDIIRLSKNVSDYYDEYLKINRIVRSIHQPQLTAEKEIYFYNEVVY